MKITTQQQQAIDEIQKRNQGYSVFVFYKGDRRVVNVKDLPQDLEGPFSLIVVGWKDPEAREYNEVVLLQLTGETLSIPPDVIRRNLHYPEDSETRTICIWPDRCWCEWDDLETYMRTLGKSDDFHTVDVSLDIDDEKLDQLISEGMYDQKGGN